MSDTDNTQDPYEDGGVPADADFNPEGGEVVEALPGAGRLDEAEDEPGVDSDDIRPSGANPLP
jgi:hypothetical protein